MSDQSHPHGATHWLVERLSSVALIPLCLWLIWSMIGLRDATYDQFIAWLSVPLHAELMAAVIIVGFLHGAMGSQVIAEDYLKGWMRTFKVIGIKVFSVALAALSLLAIHHIVF